ncbi:MAG: CxxC-x17-CxxC domain-containing protein [Patescibacteria group bacterium]
MKKSTFTKRTSSARPYGRNVGGENTLHQATCANCGKACEVPFLPRGNKPVYCKSCFKQYGKGDTEQRMYPATCGNCGNVCTVPFRPVQGKPVFCKDCYGKPNVSASSHGTSNTGDINSQLASIHAKLDTILRTLKPRPEALAGESSLPGKKPSWRKTFKKRTT